MKHVFKLQPKYFEYINTGTKRIELRLYNEKRQKKYGVVGIKIEKWYLFRKLEVFLSFRNNLLYLYEIIESRREGLKKELTLICNIIKFI